jgi:hypothetical protein
MEHADWMNEQVRGEIETLQDTHGFEEDEAVAFWHLGQAGKLMNDMKRDDRQEDMDLYEGQDNQEMWQQAIFLNHAIQLHTTVRQHITALQRALGHRVLRRNFPDGWGSKQIASLEED